jgi:hypothetical protein
MKTTMSIPPWLTHHRRPNTDDIRVGNIAAQLEEAEQKRLTDDWIEEHDVIADAGLSAQPGCTLYDYIRPKIAMGRFRPK